ncbi:MAG: type I toxin-antitoxin system SymE family toxin [Lachnospiraceae bacterium]|nr:type I toxin-antitoxin system SymE family toxin [Lachnospiraceae bacterium]
MARGLHRLKIYESNGAFKKTVPKIVIQGDWVRQFGFDIGDKVRVECYEGRLVIVNDNEEEHK